MKLLMITRKIDSDDWLAGHSFEWAKKLSSKLLASGGSLTVICQEVGNRGEMAAEVYSLGKETGAGRFMQLKNFARLAGRLVPQADGIFCHQNPEYAIAVSPWAKLYGKKIVSWYTHRSVTWKTRVMLAVSAAVLTASKLSFRLPSPKVEAVGHGIDTGKFTPSQSPPKTGGGKAGAFKIITVGRISPVKNLEVLIEAARILAYEEGRRDFLVEIYGEIGLASQQDYLNKLKAMVLQKDLDGFVHFKSSIPHSQVVPVYQSASAFVNLSSTGSLDKAVLEAMSCEVPVVTSNEAFAQMLSPFAEQCFMNKADARALAGKLAALYALKLSDRLALAANLRRIVLAEHSLDKLAQKIIKAFK